MRVSENWFLQQKFSGSSLVDVWDAIDYWHVKPQQVHILEEMPESSAFHLWCMFV
jgi:hypothetical protein